MSENGGFDMVEKINLKTEEEGEMAEERRRGRRGGSLKPNYTD